MPSHLRVLFLVFVLLFSCSANAQRRGRKAREVWPPVRAYGRTTLGNALQRVFERHYEFCGFGKVEGKRDFTPPALDNFIGSRTMRTRVEKADVNGGNLLNYIFFRQETEAPFEAIRFQPDHLLFNAATGVNLDPQPRAGFDAFLLTKNCGGYLKASVDAGLKPPYLALTAALDADDKRSSTVAALSGSFVSPLQKILAANDLRTTELMASLWQFYQNNPQYINNAFYLARFEGVMIKHLTEADQVMQFERGVGVNVSIPFAGHVGSELNLTKRNEGQFSGTDWETIVYTDFAGPYQREALYQPLPGPEDIQRYFYKLPSLASKSPTPIAPLKEGAIHRQRLTIPGLPASLAGAGWFVENVRGGAYRGLPGLEVKTPGNEATGLTFTLTAESSAQLFQLESPGAIELVPMSFDLVLPGNGHLPELRIPIERKIPTSQHPILEDTGARFELQRENNGQYSFRWFLTFNVTDGQNPINPDNPVLIENVQAGYADKPVSVRVMDSSYDERRASITCILQTDRTWPLQEINDKFMQTCPLSLQLGIPVMEGHSQVIREIETKLAMPTIRVVEVMPLGN